MRGVRSDAAGRRPCPRFALTPSWRRRRGSAGRGRARSWRAARAPPRSARGAPRAPGAPSGATGRRRIGSGRRRAATRRCSALAPTSACSGRSRRSRRPDRSPTSSSTATHGLWIDRGAGAEPRARLVRPTRPRCATSRCGSSPAAGGTSTRRRPCVDVRLGRGIRVHVVLPPVSVGRHASSRCACRAPAAFSLAALARAGHVRRRPGVALLARAPVAAPARTCSSPVRAAPARRPCSPRCSARRPARAHRASSRTSPSCASRIRTSSSLEARQANLEGAGRRRARRAAARGAAHAPRPARRRRVPRGRAARAARRAQHRSRRRCRHPARELARRRAGAARGARRARRAVARRASPGRR